MSTDRPTLTATGVEPIDDALGGLEPGRAHVVYGELDTGKSALAIQFIVEGLRAGETCALVIRYDPVEAVRVMSSFGYDCAEDLRSGRLVMLEYASDLVDQLTRVDDFSEVLAEFGWMLGDASPSRIVFDSADFIFSIQQGYGHALQISALVNWLSESGAMTLLVVEERVSERIVQAFRAHARTVMHTIKRASGSGSDYYIAFEKGAVRAPHRRVELTPEGIVTVSIADPKAQLPGRVTAPLPSSPADARTGQLTALGGEAARLVAEAIASSAPPPPPAPPPAPRMTGPLVPPSGLAPAAAPPAQPPASAPTSAAPAGPPARSGRPRVLVIDDDPTVCRLVAKTLEAESDVEITHDGIAGLAKIISFDPDLVLLDINLPLVDGFAICRQIRANSSVPIMIISGTHVKAKDRIGSAEVGADHYLIKPFSLHELALRSRQLIARYRGGSAGVPAPGAPKPAVPGDPLLAFDLFLERLDIYAEMALAGAPFMLVGCRLTTNGSVETTRIVDVVRESLRGEDAMTFEPQGHNLVVLAPVSESGAGELASSLAAKVREQTGVEVAFWTMPLAAAGGGLSQALEEQFERSSPGASSGARRDFLNFMR